MAFKFNLAAKNALGNANVKIPLGKKKKKPLLDDEDDNIKGKSTAADQAQAIEELNFDDDTLASTSAPSEPTTKKPKKGAPIAPPTKKPTPKADDPTTLAYSASAAEAEARAREAAEADATIYDYDAAYDALHAQAAAKAAAGRDDAAARKPKYLDTLLESAKQREKDHLRARDKLIQREREAEGDEFADKEKFVTGAYKAQQEEARKAEEEEKMRQKEEEEKKKKFGMQGFHKQMLAEQERRHQEAMEAAAQALKDGPKPTTSSQDADQDPEQTEAERIQELRKQGKTVILNEDGQVADKRQLLSAGLNVIVKPKPPKQNTTTPSSTSTTTQPPASLNPADKHPRNAQRERQTQMLLAQITAANKRKADDEAQQQAKLLHTAKSQKTESDIMSARERYLQRKREAEAAKAAAKAAGAAAAGAGAAK